MERKQILAGLLVALVIGAGGAGAVIFGIGPFSGGGQDGAPAGNGQGGTDGGGSGGGGDATATPVPTGTVYNLDGGTAGTGTAADRGPPFSFEIVRIESCGQTCRNVTATLYNNQNETANDVVVYTRIYAGNNTQDDNLVWQGKEPVGTMQAGAKYTTTQKVDLTYGEAFSVKQHDGWITIMTTVRSSETTITFKNRRDVT